MFCAYRWDIAMRPYLSRTRERSTSRLGTYRDNTPRRGIHHRHLRGEQLEARQLLSIGPRPNLSAMSLIDPSTSREEADLQFDGQARQLWYLYHSKRETEP